MVQLNDTDSRGSPTAEQVALFNLKLALSKIAQGFEPKGHPAHQYFYTMSQAEARAIALAALELVRTTVTDGEK